MLIFLPTVWRLQQLLKRWKVWTCWGHQLILQNEYYSSTDVDEAFIDYNEKVFRKTQVLVGRASWRPSSALFAADSSVLCNIDSGVFRIFKCERTDWLLFVISDIVVMRNGTDLRPKISASEETRDKRILARRQLLGCKRRNRGIALIERIHSRYLWHQNGKCNRQATQRLASCRDPSNKICIQLLNTDCLQKDTYHHRDSIGITRMRLWFTVICESRQTTRTVNCTGHLPLSQVPVSSPWTTQSSHQEVDCSFLCGCGANAKSSFVRMLGAETCQQH